MINLYSDTQSLPTPAMREAMSRAKVGDEQMGLDPTVNRLSRRFRRTWQGRGPVPPLRHHGQRHRPGHPLPARGCGHLRLLFAHPALRGGGLAVITGAVPEVIEAEDGRFTGDQVARHFQPGDRYTPRTTLLAVEQTCNKGAAPCGPWPSWRRWRPAPRALGMKTHMDGAGCSTRWSPRNAGPDHCRTMTRCGWISPRAWGAPFGAVLCGSEAFIARPGPGSTAWGGAMRQAGIMAAGCLHALDHHIDRLAEGPCLRPLLNDGLKQVAGIKVRHDQPSPTSSSSTSWMPGRTGAVPGPAGGARPEDRPRGHRVPGGHLHGRDRRAGAGSPGHPGGGPGRALKPPWAGITACAWIPSDGCRACPAA